MYFKYFAASMCVKQDGLADSSLIRNWDIKVSSNEEHKTDIRPGGKGWAPESGDKRVTVIIFVGDALIYGATIRLLKAKYVSKYDVFLLGGDNKNMMRFRNNGAKDIVRIPFGTTADTIKIHFTPEKPDCHMRIILSIIGCFQSSSTTPKATTPTPKASTETVSLCVKQDGLADSSLIRNWDIDVSSNEEHKADIRPGSKGWSPESGDRKASVTLFVGDALIYGANIRLKMAKCVGEYDVLLIGGEQGHVQRFKKNKPDDIVVLPFGSTEDRIRIHFLPIRPTCKMHITISIIGCFQSASTTPLETPTTTPETESLCVFSDGLADASLIRNWDISASSNEEHKTAIRPGAAGWKPAPGDNQRMITIFVGDAFMYGASIRLVRSKYVQKFDVILTDGQSIKNIRNNGPQDIIKIPFGTTANVIKFRFYSIKPDCQMIISLSIMGCFESSSTTSLAPTTGSLCVFNDGMSDNSFVRNSDIQVSSNEEHASAIRAGGRGWKPAPGDTKRTVTIFVGDALMYGGSIRLVRNKYVDKFDVILTDGKVTKKLANNGPKDVIRLPYGTSANSIKFHFYPIKPDCQLIVSLSITGCFETVYTTAAALTTTQSYCVFNDGMSDNSFVRNSDIQVSSNEEHASAIRAGGRGWKPAPGDTKRTVTIFVGDALMYGGSIRLVRNKYVDKFDVILTDGKAYKKLVNNGPHDVIRIPFGTQANSIKFHFYPIKPDCQLIVSISIKGCFETGSTTELVTTETASPCILVDGLSDDSFINNEHIQVSSNQENANDIRPGGKGWKPAPEDKRKTATFYVGDALIYGGSVQLVRSKYVERFDVILTDGQTVKNLRNNGPKDIVKIPFGIKANSFKLHFYSEKPDCQLIVSVSIKGCFESGSNKNEVKQKPELKCKMVDGMASPLFIPSHNIRLTSNNDNVDLVRPSKEGWKSAEHDNRREVTVKVGRAFMNGGKIQLKKRKSVKAFDVIFPNDENIMGNAPGKAVKIAAETKSKQVTLRFIPVKNCSVIVSVSIIACFMERTNSPLFTLPVTGKAPPPIHYATPRHYYNSLGNQLQNQHWNNISVQFPANYPQIVPPVVKPQINPLKYHRPLCVFDKCTYIREFGFEGPHIVGWIEKDGKNGATIEEEIVQMEDKVEEGVIIHVACTTCVCRNGNITCTKKLCGGCMYSEWSQWTECSKSCNNGHRDRQRERNLGNGNNPCDLPLFETQDCNSEICQAETVWSSWSSWSQCTANTPNTFGSALRKRTCQRGITEECAGQALETKPCLSLEQPKEIIPPKNPNLIGAHGTADRGVGVSMVPDQVCTNGRVWTECANRCPISCLDVRRNGVCTESDECTPGCRCPRNQVELMDQCVPVEKCPCYNSDGLSVFKNLQVTKTHPCRECICNGVGKIVCQEKPNCCLWSDWSDWGACSTSCGIGKRYRYRNLLGGSSTTCSPFKEHEAEACQQRKCPPDCNVHGKLYYHNEKIREDDCQVCYCKEFKEKCEPLPYANATAGWEEWSQWSGCTQSCHGGITYRRRACMKPAPHCGVQPCEGLPLEELPCNQNIPCFEFSNLTGNPHKCKKPHEVYFEKALCEKTCENRFNSVSPATCTKQSQCVCADGFYRNENNVCVSKDVCDSCKVNGKTYKQGQIWNAMDGCEVCQCVTGDAICKKICEIPECAINEKLVYQEHSKCCPKCKPLTEPTCGLHKTWDYLQDETGQCQSDDKLHLTYCSGGCGDSITYPVLSETAAVKTNQNCKTCVGNVAKVQQAIVTCRGQRKKTMYYPEFWCCKCTECKI